MSGFRGQAQASSPSTSLASFSLGYDAAGDVTSKSTAVFSNASNGSWTYAYDGAGRMTQAGGPNATGAASVYDFAYDGAGDRTLSKLTTAGSVVSNWTSLYNSTGLAASATDAVSGEAITYAYDPVGDLTTINSTTNANDWSYAYDAYSRQSCAKAAATACTSGTTRVLTTHDALDRTFQRTTSGTTTDYTYRGLSEDAAKTIAGTTTTTHGFTAGGSPLGQKVGTGAASYFLRDPHGDSVGVVSSTATNQGTTAFDPWGKPLATSGTQPLYGYQGSPTDPITKLVDMGTRAYAPSLGRFTTRDIWTGDPLHPISLNRFVYGADSPVTMSDPTGMGFACEQPCAPGEQEYLSELSAAVGANGSVGATAYVNTHTAPPSIAPAPAPECQGPVTPGGVPPGCFPQAGQADHLCTSQIPCMGPASSPTPTVEPPPCLDPQGCGVWRWITGVVQCAAGALEGAAAGELAFPLGGGVPGAIVGCGLGVALPPGPSPLDNYPANYD